MLCLWVGTQQQELAASFAVFLSPRLGEVLERSCWNVLNADECPVFRLLVESKDSGGDTRIDTSTTNMRLEDPK